MNGLERRVKRWRLILGEGCGFSGQPGLDPRESGIDRLLADVYGPREKPGKAERGAGKGEDGFRLLDRLTELRGLFPPDAAAVIQRDVVERTELRKLLASPKALATLKPDARTASALLAMRHLIPERSREAAREYVREVSDAMRKKLEPGLRQAVTGALSRRERAAVSTGASIDLKRTVEKNLKNYDIKSGRIIPEKLYYLRRRRAVKDLDVILALDQSASMSDSMLYSSVLSAVLCDIPALDVRVAAFDHRVADISQACREDPVGALFGLQLGGGTDIALAVDYCAGLISRPDRTLFILLTDLFDAGSRERLEASVSAMREAGTAVLVLLALSDRGTPDYNAELAARLAEKGAVCASCPPEGFADLLEETLSGMRRI